MTSVCTGLWAGLLLLGIQFPTPSPEVEVLERENFLSLVVDGVTLWTYHYDPEDGKPFFHPLASVDGTIFTAIRPKDHPWHRGLWFSWKYIDRVNYWEENRKTGLSEGRTRLLSTHNEVNEATTVRILQSLEYAPGEIAERVVEEVREIVVSAPDSSGLYTIDWTARFKALAEVALDRTPIPGEEGGKAYGGYAGLSIRMNPGMKQGEFVNGSGLKGRDAHGQPSSWVQFTLPSGAGILFMDHPDNLSSPSAWYVSRMPYVSPALLFGEPLSLRKGETFVLKYRIVVSATEVNAGEMFDEWVSISL
ncbi:MAG: PmoA family protein [Verrucomicrobiota bacterium]